MPSFQTMRQEYSNGSHSYVEISHFSDSYYVAVSPEERSRLSVATRRGRENSRATGQAQNRTPEESQAESIRRARKNIKALTLLNCNNSWRFLTLTYRDTGCHSRSQIARDIQHMTEKMETYYKRPIKYICVYELHHTGHGYHAHLIINAPYQSNEAFARQFWSHGFVKLIRLKAKDNGTSLTAVLKYLTKYISKQGPTANPGEKRYSSSRDLKRTPSTSYHKDTAEHCYNWLVATDKAAGFREVDTWRVNIGDIEMVRTILIREMMPSAPLPAAPFSS